MDYLSLIFQYYDKNQNVIQQICDYDEDTEKHNILLQFLQCDQDNNKIKQWIQYYFDICMKCKHCFSENTYKNAIDMCQNNEKLKPSQTLLSDLIKENFDKLKQFIQ